MDATVSCTSGASKENAQEAILKALRLFGGRLVAVDKHAIYVALTGMCNEMGYTETPLSRSAVKRAVGSLFVRGELRIGNCDDPWTGERIARCVLR